MSSRHAMSWQPALHSSVSDSLLYFADRQTFKKLPLKRRCQARKSRPRYLVIDKSNNNNFPFTQRMHNHLIKCLTLRWTTKVKFPFTHRMQPTGQKEARYRQGKKISDTDIAHLRV